LTLETEGFDFLKDFVLQNGMITILGNRTLFSIDIERLKTTASREFGDAYSNIGLTKFVDPNDFVRLSNKLTRVGEAFNANILISNTGNKIVEFDQSFGIKAIHSAKDFFKLVTFDDDTRLLKNAYESILTDLDGNPKINSSLSKNARLEGDFLIDFSGSELSLYITAQ